MPSLKNSYNASNKEKAHSTTIVNIDEQKWENTSGGRSCALTPGEVFLVLDGAEPEVDLQLGLDLEAAGARPPATRRLQ